MIDIAFKPRLYDIDISKNPAVNTCVYKYYVYVTTLLDDGIKQDIIQEL